MNTNVNNKKLGLAKYIAVNVLNKNINTLSEKDINSIYNNIEEYAYNDNLYTYNNQIDYYCFDNYDDVLDTVRNITFDMCETEPQLVYNYELIQEIINSSDCDNIVNMDWFNNYQYESYQNYCNDINLEKSTKYENTTRLIEELIDCDIINADDDISNIMDSNLLNEYIEKYINYMINEYDNAIDWYVFNFGEESLMDIIYNNNLIDLEILIDYLIEHDYITPAEQLDSYDGKENIYIDDDITYYIYRR